MQFSLLMVKALVGLYSSVNMVGNFTVSLFGKGKIQKYGYFFGMESKNMGENLELRFGGISCVLKKI